jgi:serine protease Do
MYFIIFTAAIIYIYVYIARGCVATATTGEIASLAGAADDPRYFQISLPVQPGNSGGALVDARGNVVGIVAAKLDASAALAAIPYEQRTPKRTPKELKRV